MSDVTYISGQVGIQVRDLTASLTDQHPDQLDMLVDHPAGQMKLRLRRNANIDLDAPVYVSDDNGMIRRDVNQESLVSSSVEVGRQHSHFFRHHHHHHHRIAESGRGDIFATRTLVRVPAYYFHANA